MNHLAVPDTSGFSNDDTPGSPFSKRRDDSATGPAYRGQPFRSQSAWQMSGNTLASSDSPALNLNLSTGGRWSGYFSLAIDFITLGAGMPG